MARLRITLGDESWEFDEEEIYLDELFAIKSATGLSGTGFGQGINDMDPAALQGLIWLLRRRTGVQQDIKSINFRIGDLKATPIPEPDESEDEANPTETGSEPVETAISDSLATTAT